LKNNSTHKRRIKLLVAYDGTSYSGWQIQPRDPSVQGEIEKVLHKIHGEPIRIHGSGRTDSGVHARGQVAHFDSVSSVPSQRFAEALNKGLPQDIRIMNSREVPGDFHARYSAVCRTYRYYIQNTGKIFPHQRLYSWYQRFNLDMACLNRMASVLPGIHDFTTFSAVGDKSESRVRRIDSASFYSEGDFCVFEISGNAFLWRMVRSLVGTLVYLERHGKDRGDMKDILDSFQREKAGPTAPARGLFLHRIDYNNDYV